MNFKTMSKKSNDEIKKALEVGLERCNKLQNKVINVDC